MRGTLRRAAAGYTRTALVATASVGLLVATLGLAPSPDGQTTEFSNGTAKATAVVSQVAPGVGNLQLGITAGVAVAEIKNTVGQAQAKAADFGLIGSTLTAESCTGGDAVITQSQLPQPTRVDSRGGNVSLAEDYIPIAGTSIGAGRKEASATTDPSALAVSKVVETLNGLLDIQGGRAEASTRVIKGEAREAHARVSFDLTLGSSLKLSGLRWDAFHRTGKDPKATADFDLGTASLLGVPIPIDSLTQAESVVNSLLVTSGLSISFPKVERFTTPADLVRVTPMRLLLKDSPLGAGALGPILNLSRTQREELFDQIAAAYCSAAGGLLVADIGVNILSGTGFLAIELGGAEAITGELVLDSPFGSETPNVELPPASSPLPPAFSPSLPVSGGTPGVQPVAEIGPLTEHCESAHPLRDTACSKGALLAVGIAGVVGTALVGALDWRHQRRRRARAEVAA
jgi:hypothetical protein